MAKKRSHESNEVSSDEAVTNHVIDLEQLPESEQSMPASEPTLPLMEEVQSFLNLRDELARKLAVEIEAMEEKLAELKKTGKATIQNAIWLAWVDLFKELGPQMSGGTLR